MGFGFNVFLLAPLQSFDYSDTGLNTFGAENNVSYQLLGQTKLLPIKLNSEGLLVVRKYELHG